MKVVVIRDMSAGNETVGEVWQETKIFEDTATLNEVLKWANNIYDPIVNGLRGPTRKRITITIPDGELENPEESL